MAQELWDAYDREGNPLGFDLVRGEPPREGIYHLVVEIYAFTPDGRILVTKRHPAKHFGGQWEITGGSPVKGETPLMGAVRELYEETGLRLPPEEFYPVYVYPKTRTGGYPCIYHCFLVFFDPAEQTIRLQEGETVDWRLLPYEEFQKLIFEDDFVVGLRERFPIHQEQFDGLLREHHTNE